MASFSYSLPDEVFAFVVEAMCFNYNYPAKVTQDGVEIDNPVSKAAFTLEQVVKFLNDNVASYKNHLGDQAKAAFIEDLNKKAPADAGTITVNP